MKTALFHNRSLIQLPFKLSILIAAAFCLWLITKYAGVQDGPQGGLLALHGAASGWRSFVWLWAPLGLALSAICGEMIASWCGRDQARAWRWDWLTLLSLPLFGLFAVLDQKGSDWALAAGVVYLATLAAKAGLAALVLWKAGDKPQADKIAAWGTALAALAFFVGLSFWTCQAVSTAGDEMRYILEAERLLQDFGLVKEHSPREGYYWGRWSDALAWTVPQSPLMKWVIAPGVLFAGRIGALAVLSLASALALGLLVSLSRMLGFSRETALLGVWALGGSAPLLQASQHLYPSAIGVLGVALGLWLIMRQSSKWPLELAATVLTGLGMGAVKYRLGTAGLGLMGSAAAEALRRSGCRRLLSFLLISLGAVVGMAMLLVLAQAIFGWDNGVWRLIAHYWWNQDPLWGYMLASLPAMFLDQQYGLLFYAPWLSLGLVGVFGLKRHSKQILYHTLWLSFCIITPLLLYRWLQWDGGFTPPGRFLASMLPLLAIWALPILERPAGKLWRAFYTSLLIISWLISLVLALIPQWRYHRMTGLNNILVWLGDLLHSPLHRLVPSFSDYYPPGMILALPWLAVLAGAGLWWWLASEKGLDKGRGLAPADWLRGLALSLTALVMMAVLARIVPTVCLEAETMHYAGNAGLHGSYFNQPKLLLLNQPGSKGATRVVWPGGEREVELQGYAVVLSNNPQYKPVKVLVSLEGGAQAEVVITPKDNWPQPHLVKLTAPPGWRKLEIVYESGVNQLALDRFVIH